MAEVRPPYRVGITGSIASGKSTVARRMKDQGIPVIDLDKVGHEVLRKRHEAFEPVVEAFGEGILGPDGEIDRKKLGALVFGLMGLWMMLNPEGVLGAFSREAAVVSSGTNTRLVEKPT